MPVTFPFGNLRFTHQISGFGSSGVATGQFEFDIYDEYSYYGELVFDECPAFLRDKNSSLTSRTYYISKRSISNNICHFTAYDVMKNIEENFDPTGLDIFFDRGELAPFGNVTDMIKDQCRLKSIGVSDSGSEWISFTKDQVTNKTCRGLLETIAESLCGVWIADNYGGIVLSCLGQPYNSIDRCSTFSKINYQGKQKITKLICTNSDSGQTREFSTGEYGTVITINSPFVANNTGLDTQVWSRLNGHIYQAWSCEKAIVYDFPPASCTIDFDGAQLLANNVTITPDSTGIYISAGCDPQDEEMWRYNDYTQRQLNNRVELGKTAGNVQINSETGIVFINKNKTSSIALENESEIEKYGFNVDAGGVTEYDGAIVSNTVFETAEKLDDKTVQINYANGISYKYTLEKDENGKIKLKKERIKEEES